MEGRLIDIPYLSSPPVLFTYRQTATLSAGSYTFTGTAPAAFTPSRPILPNVLYLFETVDIAFDIAEVDYYGAIATLPQFSMRLQSDAAPALREPIPVPKYYTGLPYRLSLMGSELLSAFDMPAGAQGFQFNRLLGNFTGVLTLTASLQGKGSITGIVVFSVQEVQNNAFIKDFQARSNKGVA